jgi:hypothetical protein
MKSFEQGFLAFSSGYTGAMKRVLRKTSILFGNVTYHSGDFSNNLHASDITVEVLDNRIILSLNLSPSQPRGSENSNSHLDAEALKEKFESLKFVQMHRESWLEDGLRSAMREAKEPRSLELEVVFKDGSVRKMPATLKPDESDFWIYRKTNSPEEVEVSRS